MTIGLITCGALAREVLNIIDRRAWDAEIIGISALDHMFPERIGPDVAARIAQMKDRYARLIVVFGDCGSKGALDRVLAQHHGIERLSGPHCYAWYAGHTFEKMMDEEPGTFFLTDFMVRAFKGTVFKGLGLDQFPQLKSDYFAHYTRVVYLIQKPDPRLLEKAYGIANYLNLPLETRGTGYGLLEEQLMRLVEGENGAE